MPIDSDLCLGIDLGTTNSAVSVFRDGSSELIPNALGDKLTPSAVAIAEDGSILVGRPALERGMRAPRSLATGFKRWMGTERRIELDRRRFSPQELSSLVLRALMADAQAALGQPIRRAVITVPAYFNDSQRRATREAALLAGIAVERLLNEPTAAGLAYGIQERGDHTSFVVLDLGGGTFDVSVLEYFEGVVQVRASAGDTRLGGDDFVHAIVEAFLAECPSLDDVSRAALRDDPELRQRAEQAKRALSSDDSATLTLERNGHSHGWTLSRAHFEARTETLLGRMSRPIEKAIRDARLRTGELQEVVLVGGATRMPMIRKLAARLFDRLPLRTIDPDLTIAIGAGLQAGLIDRDTALDEYVLTDVMPYTLGVGTAAHVDGKLRDDVYKPVIERNTPIPVSRVESFVPIEDNQIAVVFRIYQGESPMASENLKIGELEVTLAARRADESVLQVRFSYDASGLLVVDVIDKASGKTWSSTFQQAEGTLSPADFKAALARLEGLKVHPRDVQANRYLLERAQRLYEGHLGETRAALQQGLIQFEQILDSQDLEKIATARAGFAQWLDRFEQSPTF